MADAKRAANTPWRWAVLVLSSLLTLGSYFSYDLPSVLETDIMAKGVEEGAYAYLYAAYSLFNFLFSIVGGVIVDKVGVALSSIGFIALCVRVHPGAPRRG